MFDVSLRGLELSKFSQVSYVYSVKRAKYILYG